MDSGEVLRIVEAIIEKMVASHLIPEKFQQEAVDEALSVLAEHGFSLEERIDESGRSAV